MLEPVTLIIKTDTTTSDNLKLLFSIPTKIRIINILNVLIARLKYSINQF